MSDLEIKVGLQPGMKTRSTTRDAIKEYNGQLVYVEYSGSGANVTGYVGRVSNYDHDFITLKPYSPVSVLDSSFMEINPLMHTRSESLEIDIETMREKKEIDRDNKITLNRTKIDRIKLI